MIRRIEREPVPVKRIRIDRKNGNLVPVDSPTRDDEPELALRYSNGFVTVEISHDALDAYVEMTGDVPLPVEVDKRTGDRRAYDARRKIRVVYDRLARLREVTTRSRDGLYVRVNVVGEPDEPPADDHEEALTDEGGMQGAAPTDAASSLVEPAAAGPPSAATGEAPAFDATTWVPVRDPRAAFLESDLAL
jgi:hypothetical protein